MRTHVTGRFELHALLIVGVPALVTVGALGVLTRIRPSLGWSLLLGTALLTGLVYVAMAGDPRSKAGVAYARGGLLDSSSGSADTVTENLAPRTGYVASYCLATTTLCVLFLALSVVW